jgi:hypothetical protein
LEKQTPEGAKRKPGGQEDKLTASTPPRRATAKRDIVRIIDTARTLPLTEPAPAPRRPAIKAIMAATADLQIKTLMSVNH